MKPLQARDLDGLSADEVTERLAAVARAWRDRQRGGFRDAGLPLNVSTMIGKQRRFNRALTVLIHRAYLRPLERALSRLHRWLADRMGRAIG